MCCFINKPRHPLPLYYSSSTRLRSKWSAVLPQAKWQMYWYGMLVMFHECVLTWGGAEKRCRATNGSHRERGRKGGVCRQLSSSHLAWRVINRQWQGSVEWISAAPSLARRNITSTLLYTRAERLCSAVATGFFFFFSCSTSKCWWFDQQSPCPCLLKTVKDK